MEEAAALELCAGGCVFQRAAAAILILYSSAVIQRAMPNLPERIPTRFDIHGHPAAVSRPEALWLFLAAQALMVGLFLSMPYIARRAPHWITLRGKRLSDFLPSLRDQILHLIESACGWMAVGSALFMAILIWQVIRAAMDPTQGPSIWLIPVFIIALTAVLGLYGWKYWELEKNSARGVPVPRPASAPPSPPRNPIVKK